MDLLQAKIILEKINRLYQSMTLDEDNIDVFERDLMQSYIRQLYASFSSEHQSKEILLEPKIDVPKPQPQPVVKKQNPPPPPPKPVVQQPAPVVKAEPATVKVVEEIKKVEEVKQVAPPVVQQPIEQKAVTPPPAPKPAPVSKKIDPEIDALFENSDSSNDLSEKLSQRPIKDLTKSMGINERILTVNELFGGDQSVFNDTMKTLNGYRSFDAAREYLAENIAPEYNWAEKKNVKKAKLFIKLVRRRYSS